MVKKYTCIPSLTLLSCYIILVTLGLVIPFERNECNQHPMWFETIWQRTKFKRTEKREPRNREVCLKAYLNIQHLEMKQQNNHVDDLSVVHNSNHKLLQLSGQIALANSLPPECFNGSFRVGSRIQNSHKWAAQTSIRTFSTDPSSTCGVRVGGGRVA